MSRSISIIINLLKMVTPILLAFGLVITFCLKIDRLKNIILPFYPRYELAEVGIKTLEDIRYPLTQPTKKPEVTKVGVLDITHQSWGVILDFLQSEIAFRKSNRNEPAQKQPTTNDNSSETSNETSSVAPQQVNWDRLKTIISKHRNVVKAGEKPLLPPYQLFAVIPNSSGPTPTQYEFLDFKEFRLDMKEMLVNELESYAILLSLIALFIEIFVLFFANKLLRFFSDSSHTATS